MRKSEANLSFCTPRLSLRSCQRGSPPVRAKGRAPYLTWLCISVWRCRAWPSLVHPSSKASPPPSLILKGALPARSLESECAERWVLGRSSGLMSRLGWGQNPGSWQKLGVTLTQRWVMGPWESQRSCPRALQFYLDVMPRFVAYYFCSKLLSWAFFEPFLILWSFFEDSAWAVSKFSMKTKYIFFSKTKKKNNKN